MQLAPIPHNETQRLDELLSLNILDTKPEECFDRIVRIAQHTFEVPTAFIALVDKKRVWFKSKRNYKPSEGPRNISFCGHAICNEVTDDPRSRLFEVTNAEYDKRFFDNPYVTKANGIRHYLAFILHSDKGYNIGTMCIVDSRPRIFSPEDKKVFLDLGFTAETILNNSRYTTDLHTNNGNIFPKDYATKLTSLSTNLQLLQKQFDVLIKPHGINYKEWCILNEVSQLELASPHLICQKLGISASMMTRKLEALEIKGLIERWNSTGEDRRFVYLACTERGGKIWRRGINHASHLTELYLDDLI